MRLLNQLERLSPTSPYNFKPYNCDVSLVAPVIAIAAFYWILPRFFFKKPHFLTDHILFHHS